MPIYGKESAKIFTDSPNRERENDVPFRAFSSGNTKPIKMQNAFPYTQK